MCSFSLEGLGEAGLSHSGPQHLERTGTKHFERVSSVKPKIRAGSSVLGHVTGVKNGPNGPVLYDLLMEMGMQRRTVGVLLVRPPLTSSSGAALPGRGHHHRWLRLNVRSTRFPGFLQFRNFFAP